MTIDIEKIKEGKTLKELMEFGIINVDKPSGPTSFDVSDTVRKILGLRKTSHFGTLDPQVTGVLPIALNRACKLTGFFLGEDKEYVGIMRIHGETSVEELKKIIKEKFTGKIKQRPPVRSRVARVLREREIKIFEILEKEGNDFLFRAEVQGGTYIRKLIDDLGKELNIGAHMLELRRVRAGIFKEDSKKYPSVTLYEIEKAAKEKDEKKLREMIIPGEIVSEIYPAVKINEDEVEKILHGQPIYRENLIEKNKTDIGKNVTVFSDNRFMGVFKVVSEGRIFAKPEFVLQPL